MFAFDFAVQEERGPEAAEDYVVEGVARRSRRDWRGEVGGDDVVEEGGVGHVRFCAKLRALPMMPKVTFQPVLLLGHSRTTGAHPIRPRS